MADHCTMKVFMNMTEANPRDNWWSLGMVDAWWGWCDVILDLSGCCLDGDGWCLNLSV